MKPRRYQLNKHAVAIVRGGHPWIFRDQLSSAASVFADGDWLRLHAGDNSIVGYGIYEATGAIAIRILRRGTDRPDATWLRGQLAAALARRRDLAATTDGIRLLHGESDGIPAVVADRFGDSIVVATYSTGADALARYVSRALASPDLAAMESTPAAAEPPVDVRAIVGPARNVVLRAGRRRTAVASPARVIRGSPIEIARFVEDGVEYAVDLGGHKTGAYLDLRGLRRAMPSLAGGRVLNLFAYTGMLGLAAELAGAAEVVSVDASAAALELAKRFHVRDPARHRLVTADVFDWLPALGPSEQFDLVIVDPPAMTSRTSQVPGVLAAYSRLYRAAARHVQPGGAIVAACCTSRIERGVFRETVRAALGGFRLELELPPEPDHPVGFPQADYLKIEVWRRNP